MRTRLAAFLRTARRSLSRRVEPELKEQVADEQLRMMWLHSRIGIVGASAFAVLLALNLDVAAGPLFVRAWIAVKLAIAAYRMLQGETYARRGHPGGRHWRRATYVLLAIDGAVWGVAGFWLMSQSIPTASLVGAALACISCVATFGLQVSSVATAAYVLPILAPTIVALLLRGDEFGWIGGLGLLVLLALQLATARRSEQRLAESLRLRLQAQALAIEKDEALKLALRQSVVKSQFLANISHELRTPLHGILGLSRVLHLEIADPALGRRVELIEASGTHLLALINDLLDISRIEAGQFAMRKEVFELVAQLEQVAAMHAVRADDKGLAFLQSIRLERPCWVMGDPARFRQVLHNLIGNAIKFTRQGSVHLAVERLSTQADVVCVQVGDSGPGIAPQELAHIFEAFRQSGNAASRPREGAGLGLTIAREIAQAMGGDVTVQSQLGVGSTLSFTARLPSAPAPALAPAGPQQEPNRPACLPCHVLIAEDDDVNALIATVYLERLGAAVTRVSDGRQAVRQAVETDRPELILMDCRMPAMDGYAATREIRAREMALGLARVPVIALTATVTDADRQLCLEAGMDDFLAKPFTPEQLAAVMGRWLPVRSEFVAADVVTAEPPA